VFRFANIVGPHQRGNVIPDFIQKLDADPSELEILGDGRQEKSYMHVSECVDAIQHVVEHADEDLNVYNLGTETTTSVTDIADIVSDELGVDPEYAYTGGDRGWTGDVPKDAAVDRAARGPRLGAVDRKRRGGSAERARTDRRDRLRRTAVRDC